MKQPLYKLVYISHNELSGDDAHIRREIEHILATARTKNQKANITGALMFNAGCFAQVLEGSHDDIQSTFERIQCDLRHSNVTILSFEPASERIFSNWSMAYIGANTSAMSEFKDIMQRSDFSPGKLASDQIFDLLKAHLLDAELAMSSD